jgi:hypothetical protein
MENTYYEDLRIEDLPNEIWIDALGFDGIYAVSNLGRVKSSSREMNTRWGTPRLLPEKIMKQQATRTETGIPLRLQVCLNSQTKNIAPLIFKSFNPNVDFEENECVMHINKNLFDNRLENLAKATRVVSKSVDMAISKPTIKATPQNLKKAMDSNKEFFDTRTHKECSVCGKLDEVKNFDKGISKCRRCLRDYVITRRKNYVYQGEEKTCNRCGITKNDSEFHKLNGSCKKCSYDLHKAYVDKQKKEFGDFYVKEYGKARYGIKEFDQELIDKLRSEMIEKRKPKHHFDGKEFFSTNEFAKYIYENYKIPLTTTKARIQDGRSEYECSLNRKQFTQYNKIKLAIS